MARQMRLPPGAAWHMPGVLPKPLVIVDDAKYADKSLIAQVLDFNVKDISSINIEEKMWAKVVRGQKPSCVDRLSLASTDTFDSNDRSDSVDGPDSPVFTPDSPRTSVFKRKKEAQIRKDTKTHETGQSGRAIQSCGIIFLRETTRECLLIRRAGSYAGCSLDCGREFYRTQDLNQLFADSMTLAEKDDVLLDDSAGSRFKERVAIAFSSRLDQLDQYAQSSFIRNAALKFVADVKVLKPFLINSVKNRVDGPIPWSFPKGRVSKGDRTGDEFLTRLRTAQREIREETGITPDMYTVLLDVPQYTQSWDDMGRTYSMSFFFAVPNETFKWTLDPSNIKQRNEVSDIRWMSRATLSCERLDRITTKYVLDEFSSIFAHYHKHHVVKKPSTAEIRAALYR